jgi:hypothetical protein
MIITLWLFNIAMENCPFIDDFPIKTSIYKGFSMAMLNNQMVYDYYMNQWRMLVDPAAFFSATPGIPIFTILHLGPFGKGRNIWGFCQMFFRFFFFRRAYFFR